LQIRAIVHKRLSCKSERSGFGFLDNEKHQKLIFQGKTLKEALKDIYLKNKTSDFIMYGSNAYTLDHMDSDGGYPDQIYLRPDWYLFYVQNLSWLLSEKFKLDNFKLDLDIFKKMARFASKQKCSLKGIIDYEITKKLNKKTVYVPVFYSESIRVLASGDAIIMTNYLQTAKDIVENTKKYLIEQGISANNIKIEEIDNWFNPKINGGGVFVTEAFKITIN
jgi:hypothetical protein